MIIHEQAANLDCSLAEKSLLFSHLIFVSQALTRYTIQFYFPYFDYGIHLDFSILYIPTECCQQK